MKMLTAEVSQVLQKVTACSLTINVASDFSIFFFDEEVDIPISGRHKVDKSRYRFL